MGTLENKQLPTFNASLGDFKRSGVDEQTASGEGDEITVAVSVNTKIINKHKGGNHQFFAEGWDNYELPLSIFLWNVLIKGLPIVRNSQVPGSPRISSDRTSPLWMSTVASPLTKHLPTPFVKST